MMRSPLRTMRLPVVLLGCTVVLGSVACSPSSLVDVQSPSTVVDPSLITTPAAAKEMYIGALGRFGIPIAGDGIGDLLTLDGAFTDELTETQQSDGETADRRLVSLNHTGNIAYGSLHQARVRSAQAIEALQTYAADAPDIPKAWQGQLYAMQAYTVLWFAEFYCSGIPLTTVPLKGPQVMTRGYTTQELYERAILLFDSALVLGADSSRFVNLAAVGKGRALLGLGRFAAADSAVRNVPTDFVYLVQFTVSGNNGYANFFPEVIARGFYRVQDNEGINGLVWSSDPRTGIVKDTAVAGEMLWPAKYNINSSGVPDPESDPSGVPFRLADGLEARLIQAEASLAAGDASWLTTLNSLRATCIGTTPCAPIPGLTSASLPALTDPGSASTRLDLLMKERAMWLYLTAHREGDLRRMAHVYQRSVSTLWPTGVVTAPAFPPLYFLPLSTNGTAYGTDVVFEPNPTEQVNNPLYGGCYDHNP